MLHDPEHHEPLTGRAWNAAWVRDAIAAVVADTLAAYNSDDFWPTTEYDLWGLEPPLMEVYTGAAGIAWGLLRLGAPVDATRIHARYREQPTDYSGKDRPAQWRSSLLAGETGIAFVAYAHSPTPELDDILLGLVLANLGNETNELMWGVPGTLLVARAMHTRTGGERWAEAVRVSADELRAARDPDGWWTQHLDGHVLVDPGPVHGFVGNVHALGGDDEAAPRLLRESAQRENGHVNWPPWLGGDKRRLQWCHGAPGILATAASYLDEDLVVGGAQLIWDAGPMSSEEKGSGICHGTAGNGYGLLKAFERTQDERWLARARAFAVHALEQARALPPRHSLFNGALGAAVFATDCVEASARYPVLDDWL